jgi:hypothetical protein
VVFPQTKLLQRYVVRIFFTQLLHCDEHTVVFMIHYYTKLKKRIKRKIIKQLESPMYTIRDNKMQTASEQTGNHEPLCRESIAPE